MYYFVGKGKTKAVNIVEYSLGKRFEVRSEDLLRFKEYMLLK